MKACRKEKKTTPPQKGTTVIRSAELPQCLLT